MSPVFQFGFLVTLLIPALAMGQAPSKVKLPTEDWTVTRERFQPDIHRGLRNQGERFRLVCETQQESVEAGQPIRLFVGVQLLKNDDEQLLNPFVDVRFPSGLCVAIFDEQDRFVSFLPHEAAGDPVEESNEETNQIHGRELRGCFVDIRTDSDTDEKDAFAAVLPPGKYRFVLIARLRFYRPQMIQAGEQNVHPTDKNWWQLRDFEVNRSQAATIQVTNTNLRKPHPQKLPAMDEGRLLAQVTIEESAAANDVTRLPRRDVWLRLTNNSRTTSIGVMDPFHRQKATNRPVQWTLRQVGRKWDLATDVMTGNCVRSNDIVVIPPQGVVFAKALPIHNEPGRYETSVDLTKGVVDDPAELKRLLSKPVPLLWDKLEPRTNQLHPDSILSARIVVDGSDILR